jgi:hypothetical protein
MNVIINVYETEKDKLNTKNGSSHHTFLKPTEGPNDDILCLLSRILCDPRTHI